MRKRFNLAAIEVRQTPQDDKAEVYIGDAPFADLQRDEDEGELSYVLETGFRLKREDQGMLESHIRERFNIPNLEVRKRPQKDDSDELYVDDEFIAVLYHEDAGSDISYHIAMSILDFDLEDI